MLDAALEPLREPTDPRAAVIEAYARMEEVLASRELGRRTPEAPREYLTRVLRRQGMPERSLTSLTELFEEARFSSHPIPTSASARARSELETAREALPVGGGTTAVVAMAHASPCAGVRAPLPGRCRREFHRTRRRRTRLTATRATAVA